MIYVGTSGWLYPPWRGDFYPPGLAHRRELAHLSRRVNSIEINGSFYSLKRPEHYRSWAEQTPPGFVFAVKGGRFITHMKRLRDAETPLANFFASGVLELGDKLGPVLWQLPPTTQFNGDVLGEFLNQLPRTTVEAARLAEQHDERMDGRAATKAVTDRPLRHALEVRHPSFRDPALAPLLREHNVALVTADTAGKWPFLTDQTADFAYARLHGDTELYVSGYDDEALDTWAERIISWTGGPDTDRDCYVYFDNDVKVRAPFDAMALAQRLGVSPEVAS